MMLNRGTCSPGMSEEVQAPLELVMLPLSKAKRAGAPGLPRTRSRKKPHLRDRVGQRGLPKKCYVIGVGNPLMGDDGIGIEVARSLRRLGLEEDVVIMERQVADLSLLASSKEASKLVIVDAVETGRCPGSVMRLELNRPHSGPLPVRFSHELGLRDFAALVRESGLDIAVVFLGVQVGSCGPGEGLSKPVADALPKILKRVLSEVGNDGRTTYAGGHRIGLKSRV